jgi:hypothetical protein
MYRNLTTVLLAAFVLAGCPYGQDAPKSSPAAALPKRAVPTETKVTVSVREGKIKQYPCMECHDKVEPGLKPPLDGKHRGMKFDHFEGATTCEVCHAKDNMNRLKLTTGKLVGFDESHKMCGQCHGERYRDWKIGAHGKFVGGWKGQKSKLTCADCHDPHKPGFDAVTARPAPPFPHRGIPKNHGGHP